ncbi:alpha/beta hydrolase [Mycobacterium sp. 21AC1]|uniref:alpha/beta hydrolase n=1 Tax=[Mycobacterium] appelbergii TaxID=2939269 RepID=UPI002938FEA3|nr:alpha/beta hydrolase [Mycobacterium sp. 21AC1]MDV3125715.1 alpha/beta hydrolase [Mycobacterium sp. 21AC1]
MTVTIPQVETSNPGALAQAGDDLSHRAGTLAAQISKQQATLDTLRADWQGGASDAAVAKAQSTLSRLQRLHEVMLRTQTAMHDGGSHLTQSRSAILNSVEKLAGQRWNVAPDGTVSVRPGSALDQYAKRNPVDAMTIRALAARNSSSLKQLLAQFETADGKVDQNIRNAVTGLDSKPMMFGPDGGPPQTPQPDEPPIPLGKDPVQVRDWWNSLTPEQRKEMPAKYPKELGNLNGVPVWARSEANKIVMQQDIDRVANAAGTYHVDVGEVTANPGRYGLSPSDVTRYTNAIQVQKGLTDNARNTGQQTFLQVYEPEAFGGQGRAAVAIGNPDDAVNTAVLVPGTGNSVRDGWLGGPDAARVYNETASVDPSKPTAVVAWMGYNAPDSMTDPQVGQTGNARQGGGLLAADVNALETTNHGDSHVTVIGHSYGSTTVADAAAGSGMRADDIVLVGCPGTDLAKSAADFHLPEGGNVFVGAASTDPVTHLGGGDQVHIPGTDVTVALGADPAVDGYGSTRFKAEVPGMSWPWKDHSEYFTPGSESLFSIADIASGDGDLLQDHGMTADHRLTTVPVDPEIWRRGTGDHYHGPAGG